MGFYDNNPGAKDAFATAGAIHDGTSSTEGTTDSADPTKTSAPAASNAQLAAQFGGTSWSDGSSSGSVSYSSQDPATDPYFNAVKAGVPAGTLQMMYGGQGLAFEGGGAMPDDAEDNTIDQLLAHGRQSLGLMQMAGAIPSAPGTQSPNMPRPAPGPLPPTSNPFGKRPTPPTPGRLAEVVPGPQGGAGPTTKAIPYYMGKQTDPKVQPIPTKTSEAAIPDDDQEEAA